MVKSVSNLRSELRQSVSRFLGDRRHKELRVVLDTIRRSSQSAFIFGGALRDLSAQGSSVLPRDIDIVADQASFGALSEVLAPYVRRRNRFGGLHLEAGGWVFDVWPLEETWAFQVGARKLMGFHTLPRTTFLNVEAVVADIKAKRGRARRLHSSGFFEGFRAKKVEINLEANPYPALCIVRALVTAARLRFSIGPQLARYILHFGRAVPLEELAGIQQSHYGRAEISLLEIANWIRHINNQYRVSPNRPIRIPVPDYRQLELWKSSRAAR